MWDFVAWALVQAESARHQHGGRTECFFDDSQGEVYGCIFGGAACDYTQQLALDWQTLADNGSCSGADLS